MGFDPFVTLHGREATADAIRASTGPIVLVGDPAWAIVGIGVPAIPRFLFEGPIAKNAASTVEISSHQRS